MDKWIQYGVTALLFPGSIVNSIIRKKEEQPPAGKMLHTPRGTFHVIEKGQGPLTIMMDAGLSGSSLHWHHVQEKLSQHAHTISFDRGGYGWSDRRSGQYDGKETVKDMTAILEGLGCTSPLVMVGHSYGGLNVRLFAQEHRKRVKGIVLVDAVHEERYETEETDRMEAIKKNLRWMKLGYYSAYTGVPRLLKMKVGGRMIAKEVAHLHSYMAYKPSAYEAVYKELRDSGFTARQVKESTPLHRDLFMTIIQSNNKSPEWLRYQEKLQQLTDHPTVILTDHGHNIHMENPSLVARAVSEQLKKIDTHILKEESVRS
ncbi:alpha/beta fold hydrolase [Bacillus sp. KH172YL63]|uniref:alpha/beta fold hydrolase n=1 Tax=Bacillus sp. KH172YL63 TaxID=2709784 RepID=UPI0013E42949|nr:alpha/beta fold hydrolase [Bacillus sp. KH172YL63]BCB04629.1 hypothetical protein KH172YL63_27620 [Bacillus sp. KH172YL63]